MSYVTKTAIVKDDTIDTIQTKSILTERKALPKINLKALMNKD